MRRVVQGIPLLRREGMWHTEDGRYTISMDYGAVTMCENPHPVRTGRWQGYQCPGGEEHAYPLWNVWDNQAQDHAFGDVYDTMRDAVYALAQHLKEQP